jgi:hypothetical protein
MVGAGRGVLAKQFKILNISFSPKLVVWFFDSRARLSKA